MDLPFLHASVPIIEVRGLYISGAPGSSTESTGTEVVFRHAQLHGRLSQQGSERLTELAQVRLSIDTRAAHSHGMYFAFAQLVTVPSAPPCLFVLCRVSEPINAAFLGRLHS